MSVDLYDSQKKAVENMSNGCILCGGVGTGKSRTALAYYYTKVCGGKLPRKGGPPYESPILRPLYIITTAKKRDSKEWEMELAHFCIDSKRVVIDSWNNINKYTEIGGGFFIFASSTMRNAALRQSWTRSSESAAIVPLPGSAIPSASQRQFMLFAVNIPEQEPGPGHAEHSRFAI